MVGEAARSVLVFGMYRALLGAGLVIVPGRLAQLAGAPADSVEWLRIVGVLLLVLAFYDVEAARLELLPYLQMTVLTRLLVPVALAVFVVLRAVRPGVLAFGALELAGALWTRRTISASP